MSIIFYFHPKKAWSNSYATYVRGVPGKFVGFVRTEKFNGPALMALDNAKPRKGETVLNTVELEEA